MKKQITIFTPTYNRANTLPQLYQSLCEQDNKDFVWLVVDDGSTDGTSALINQWQGEQKIEIDYHQQQNRGKAKAHNKGVMLCKTPLFVCIDSDDYLASPTVVTDTLRFWNEHAEARRSDVCGMVSYRKMVNGPHAPFPDVKLATLSQLYDAGYKGETTLVFKTDILRNHPFPEIEGEKFITEAIVYDRLDTRYKLLVFPYESQVCEFRNDGITNNGWDVLHKNPKGYRMYYNQLLELGKGPKVYNMKMYIACSLLAADGKTFSSCSSKTLLLLLYPLGLYQYHKLRNRKW